MPERRTNSSYDGEGISLTSRDAQAVAQARVHGHGAGAGDGERCGHQHEREHELIAGGQEEPAAQVHGKDRTHHDDGESRGGDAREQADHEGESAEELTERDERRQESRQRNATLGKSGGEAVEAEHEDLLRAVRDEDRAEDEAQEEEAEIDLGGLCGTEEAHDWVPW